MSRHICMLAALAISAVTYTPAQAAEKYPQVKGFKELHLKPDCMIVGTSLGAPTPDIESLPDGTKPDSIQTLWVDNACTTSVSFDRISNTYAQGAHEAMGTLVVFGQRSQSGTRFESKPYTLQIDAEGSACIVTNFLISAESEGATKPQAKCKSITLAPNESVGFRPYAPIKLEWHGADGALVAGEVLQE